MSTPRHSPSRPPASYKDAPTRSISVGGVDFVYRQLGPGHGVPLILLHHLAAVLDNWDPRVVDGMAARRQVITFDNRGVGCACRPRDLPIWPLLIVNCSPGLPGTPSGD